MTHIYLAFGPYTNGGLKNGNMRDRGAGRRSLAAWDYELEPINLLVSFYFIEMFDKWAALCGPTFKPPRMMLDSGAFSAWSAGASIDEGKLIETARQERWTERVSLDVIGGTAQQTLDATRRMREGGVASPIPVFHYGEDWGYLRAYAEEFGKVGLSITAAIKMGQVSRKGALVWLEGCFARAWPCAFHLMGQTSENFLLRFPLHSADASSYELKPCGFGSWPALGLKTGEHRLRASAITNVDVEIRRYAQLQKRLRSHWRREMAVLEARGVV